MRGSRTRKTTVSIVGGQVGSIGTSFEARISTTVTGGTGKRPTANEARNQRKRRAPPAAKVTERLGRGRQRRTATALATAAADAACPSIRRDRRLTTTGGEAGRGRRSVRRPRAARAIRQCLRG